MVLDKPGTVSPRVSVVLAAYNAQHTIAEALESLLCQTHADIEIVVCDDASTDRTWDVLQRYQDERLTLLRNPENLGPGPSRDRAIAGTSGAWIVIVDADDVLVPHRIERLLYAGNADESVVVFDDIVECHDTESGLVPWRRVYGEEAFGGRPGSRVDITHADWLSNDRQLMKAMFPAAIIRHHGIRHSQRRFAEDSEFILKVLSKGAKLRYLSEPLYRYRLSPGSLTANPARWEGVAEMFEHAISWFDDREVRAALVLSAARARRHARYHRFVHAVRAGQLGLAFRKLVATPSIAGMLVKRLLFDLDYRVRRRLHGGRKR